VSRAAVAEHAASLRVIYALDPLLAGRRYLLEPPVTTVGRQGHNDIVIGCNSMSRRHARFERRQDGWWVVDLSTNGTLVDGERVSERRIRCGDRVQLGRTILRMSDPDEESEIVEVEYTGSPFDGLTGLFARHHLVDCIERALEDTRRSGAPLALARLDIVRFKSLNDRYGHAAGDDVLREVARIGRAHVPSGGVLARPRGDELALLLPGFARHDAAAVADAIRASLLAHTFAVGEASLPGLASRVGAAQASEATRTARDLFQAADPKRR
jgi:two-component system cell cycle response regulator